MKDNQPLYENIAQSISNQLKLSYIQYVNKGAFKEVYELTDNDKLQYALKVFNPHKCNIIRKDREIDSMKKCNCKNIALLYEHGNYKDKGILYFFTLEEYMSRVIIFPTPG